MADSIINKSPESYESWSSNNITVDKIGRFVSLSFGNVTIDSNGYFTTTLPEKYRPMHWVTIFSKCYDGNSYVDCQVLIFSDGKIRIGTLSGSPISGLQPSFFQFKPIIYMTAQ